MRRVMTWVTRIVGEAGGCEGQAVGEGFEMRMVRGSTFQLVQAFGDAFSFVGIGRGVIEVEFEEFDGLGGVFAAPRDFAEAEVDGIELGETLVEDEIILVSFIELPILEEGDGAVHEGGLVMGIGFEDAIDGVDGVGESLGLDGECALGEEGLDVLWIETEGIVQSGLSLVVIGGFDGDVGLMDEGAEVVGIGLELFLDHVEGVGELAVGKV
jgi:hypothetical protein